MNTARSAMGTAGSYTAGIIAGGESPAGNNTITELWNGTNWTEVNDLNLAKREMGGAGSTNTAALVFGGADPNPNNVTAKTEDWNGVSWSETSDLNTARYQLNNSGLGTTSAAAAVGGKASYGGPTAQSSATEEWNLPSTTTKTISTD